MFTGIVQAVGTIKSPGGRLIVDPGELGGADWIIGESIAVNGCCLTLTGYEDGLAFDLSEETLSRTSFGGLNSGAVVNLERALRAGDPLGGHFVQGHVDAVGGVLRAPLSVSGRGGAGGGETLIVQAPQEHDRYLIDKGSITIDGISLTVIAPDKGLFQVAVIPHTLEHTNIQGLKAGDKVNLEFDVLAKYVEKMFGPRT